MMSRTWLGHVSALAIVVAASACNGPLEVEEHGEAFGLEIVDESGGVVASVNSARQVTGNLSVTTMESIDLDVYFLDRDGDRFKVDPDDGEIELVWQVGNTAIAEMVAVGDGHRLTGKAAGTTTVEFTILHGGHSDYEAPAIPINVVAGSVQ